MVVHAHQAGHDRAAGQIDPLRAARRLRHDLSAGDEQRLILARRRARAVDDPDVFEGKRRRLHLDERLQRGIHCQQYGEQHVVLYL